MKKAITLKVNGESYDLVVNHNRTLLEVLRDDLELTGTKEGCSMGECGACTVLIDGRTALSCIMLASDANGQEIVTIEGIAQKGELHPIQKSFVEHGAFQCGFCTPSKVLSAKALLDRNPVPMREEIKTAIAGSLCRCTGYTKYVNAIEAVAEANRRGET